MTAALPRPARPGFASAEWALTAALLLAPAAHLVLGLFSRVTADTYCHGYVVLTHGLLGSLRHHYFNWSGRYAHYVFEGASMLAGPAAFPLIVPVWLLLWLAALLALVWPLASLSRARRALLAALALAATLGGLSSPGTSLYWTDGLHNYVSPLMALTGVAALAAQRAVRPAAGWRQALWLAGAFVLAVVAAGSTEMVAVLQVAVLGLAAAGLLRFGSAELRRRLLPLLGVALVGALAGLLIVATAPGNQVRLAEGSGPPSLPMLAWTVVTATLICTGIVLKAGHWLLAAAVAVPAVLAATSQAPRAPSPRLAWALLLGIPAGTAALIAAALLPAVYGLGGLPPARGITVVAFVLVLGLMAWGAWLGVLARPRLHASPAPRRWLALAAAVLCLAAVAEAAAVAAPLPRFAAYAAAWQSNHTRIRAAIAAGASEVAVPPLDNPTGLPDLGADSRGDVTLCMALYYGITVKTAGP